MLLESDSGSGDEDSSVEGEVVVVVGEVSGRVLVRSEVLSVIMVITLWGEGGTVRGRGEEGGRRGGGEERWREEER